MKNNHRVALFLLIWIFTSAACSRAFPTQASFPTPFQPGSQLVNPTSLYSLLPPTRAPETPYYTPTPDLPHEVSTGQSVPETYTVQAGDTLGKIAELYDLHVDSLIAANPDINPNYLAVGQEINIPVVPPQAVGSDFKIIPDSELVNGPFAALFDISAFIDGAGGYLSRYTEKVNGSMISGAEVVDTVAREYSVNPRLLLAILEYQSGWVTQSNPSDSTLYYPMGYIRSYWEGLYVQLSWAANELNRGFYEWQIGAVSHWILSDGNLIPISTTINPGTAGVQNCFSVITTREKWDKAVSENGIYETYIVLFGNPFDNSFPHLLPDDLTQSDMQLPFDPGDVWYLTSGPHSAWGDGAAWAALDFAPPDTPIGCSTSSYWVSAVADGLITRTGLGIVIQDLDGDGAEQTGWATLYMHIAGEDMVATGTYVKAGDHIGHPSCEGGISNGTHLHIARRYNGVWISGDGSIPFVLDGWISQGTGIQYDGYLVKNARIVTALNRKAEENEISR